MQENDPIEECYRNAFSGFEPPPPERAWEKIRKGIQPGDVKEGRVAVLKKMLIDVAHSGKLYPLLATAAMILLLIIIWASYSNKHSIRGHAYAGETRISRGSAFLFRVYDKVKPWDTVKLVQSVPVDANGYYQFNGLVHGNYMVRINPWPGTEITRYYLPSCYNQDSAGAEVNLIRIEGDDPTIDIHLVPR
jgi:hypothetical protein